MRNHTSLPLAPCNIDRQLVAAVQVAAGARCHQAANLIQSYYIWVKFCNLSREQENSSALEEAQRMVDSIETALRRFREECRLPGGLHTVEKRDFLDVHSDVSAGSHRTVV